MRRYVQELISNLNQESLLLRHIHFICQRIIPAGSGLFFSFEYQPVLMH